MLVLLVRSRFAARLYRRICEKLSKLRKTTVVVGVVEEWENVPAFSQARSAVLFHHSRILELRCISSVWASIGFHLNSNRPDKAQQFSSYRGDHFLLTLAFARYHARIIRGT